MNQTRQDGKRILISGSSGCGKTSTISAMIGKTPDKISGKRLLIWDIDNQLTEQFKAKRAPSTINQLPYINVGGKYLLDTTRDFKIGYVSNNARGDFDKFCKLAFHLGKVAPITVIVEELADVSTVGKASNEWGILVRRGRKYGINVIATTQRVAEIDKTIVANASDLIVFRHQFTKDLKYLSDLLQTKDLPKENLKFAWFKPANNMSRLDYRVKVGKNPTISKK